MEARVEQTFRYVLEQLGGWFRRRWAWAFLYVPVILLVILGRNTTRPIFFVDAGALAIIGLVVTDPYRLVSKRMAPESRAYFCVLEAIMVTSWNLPLNWVAQLFISGICCAVMALAQNRNAEWMQEAAVLMSPAVIKSLHALRYNDPCAARDDWRAHGSLEVRTVLASEFKFTATGEGTDRILLMAYMIGHVNGCQSMERIVSRSKQETAGLETLVEHYKAQVAELLEELNQNGDAAQQLEYKVAEISRLNGVIRKLNAQLEELTEAESRDHKILRLKAEGKTGEEIAAACGCSTGTVSNVLKKQKDLKEVG